MATNTTHDDNATTWRDLADQLTPGQIAELEYCEREQIPPGIPDPAQGQLNCARAMARSNLVQALCAGIAPPADAVDEPSAWQEWGDGRYGRMYSVAAPRASEKLSVSGERVWLVDIFGVQFDDGAQGVVDDPAGRRTGSAARRGRALSSRRPDRRTRPVLAASSRQGQQVTRRADHRCAGRRDHGALRCGPGGVQNPV